VGVLHREISAFEIGLPKVGSALGNGDWAAECACANGRRSQLASTLSKGRIAAEANHGVWKRFFTTCLSGFFFRAFVL
jgi:hypothetical protein